MLCTCSGEQFKFEDAPRSPESLATRDFSASGLSSRTGEWESKFDDTQVGDVESTLKEAISLNYEEARALLGRLEYQRGNFDAALQVFRGIEIRILMPRMIKAIADSESAHQRKGRHKSGNLQMPVMSMHSVSLLLEAILLKAKSLEALGHPKDAASECEVILDTVEVALPNGMPNGFGEDCKLLEIFHKALELLPELWKKAGRLHEAVSAYRRALVKPWSLDFQKMTSIQKDLASVLLYSEFEANLLPRPQVQHSGLQRSNLEEAILLLFIIMRKMAFQEIPWDPEIMDHLTFALSTCGQFEILANHFEQALPGIYSRTEIWYLLALSYIGAGQNYVALNLLRKVITHSKKQRSHLPSLLLGAKLCSQNSELAYEGIDFARLAIECIKPHQGHHYVGVGYYLFGVCAGRAAESVFLDSERVKLQKESLKYLYQAFIIEKDNPQILLSLGLENAKQRNLDKAFENMKKYIYIVGGSSALSWKLMALIMSAEQCFKNAEDIVDIALDEMGREDLLEFWRLKAMLQVAQERPRNAVESYQILLSLAHQQKEPKKGSSSYEDDQEKKIKMEAWQDLAFIYKSFGSMSDAQVCVDKARSLGPYSPTGWHATGVLFEAQSLNDDALDAFYVALSMDPDHVPSMVSTAALLITQGKKSLPIARSLLMNALRVEPTNHDAWLNLGLVLKMDGLLQQAADCLIAAYELKQSSPLLEFA